jgi:lycopene beta-cyclase
MKQYEYIILGAGASGLLLAYRMSKDIYFDDKEILIIDQIKDKGNDRTWCYWEEGTGEWDDVLTKSWPKVFFGSDSFSKTISIAPFTYKMIRSKKLYDKLWKSIGLKANITFVEDSVKNYTEFDDGVKVVANKSSYSGLKLLNSIPDKTAYKTQKKISCSSTTFYRMVCYNKNRLF